MIFCLSEKLSVYATFLHARCWSQLNLSQKSAVWVRVSIKSAKENFEKDNSMHLRSWKNIICELFNKIREAHVVTRWTVSAQFGQQDSIKKDVSYYWEWQPISQMMSRKCNLVIVKDNRKCVSELVSNFVFLCTPIYHIIVSVQWLLAILF